MIYEEIYWFQAEESMEYGDYVICDEDPCLRKTKKGELPMGRVSIGTYTNEYVIGDRVPVRYLFNQFGYLKEVLKIGDFTFVVGENRITVEKALGLYIEPKFHKCPKCGGKGVVENVKS